MGANARLNFNSNNGIDLSVGGNQQREIPILVMIQLILLALDALDNQKGSTMKDIRKILYISGFISEQTDLRQAMVFGIKNGEIARPEWAAKAGVYGRYIRGDGIPLFLGKKEKKHWAKKSAKSGKMRQKDRPTRNSAV